MLTSLMATQLPLSMLVTHKTYTTEGADSEGDSTKSLVP